MNEYPSLSSVMPVVRQVWKETEDLHRPFGLRLEGDGSAIAAGPRRWYSINITYHADSIDVDHLSNVLKQIQRRIEQEIKAPVTLTMIPLRPTTNGAAENN